jgi:hypothetical protein
MKKIETLIFFQVVPERYPTKEQQEQLFTAYLRQWKRLKAAGASGVDINPTKEEIETLSGEANEYALAAHILWSLWGIIQSSNSEIEFGYLEFAHARMGEYFRLKKLLDESDHSSSPSNATSTTTTSTTTSSTTSTTSTVASTESAATATSPEIQVEEGQFKEEEGVVTEYEADGH